MWKGPGLEGGEYGIFGWTEAFGARKVAGKQGGGRGGGLVSYRNGPPKDFSCVTYPLVVAL